MKRYFQNLFRAMAGDPIRDPRDDFWYSPIGAVMMSAAGAPVTPETALRVPTVVDCLTALAQPIASLPLGLFRRLPNGDKERVTDHWLYRLLHTQPAESGDGAATEYTDYEMRGQLQWHLGLHNNAYAEIVPGADAQQRFFDDPHHVDVGRVEHYQHAEWGEVRDVAVLLRMSGATEKPSRPAPLVGEHTDEILAMVGYDDGQISSLRDARAVR